LSTISAAKSLYLSYLSAPAADRPIYRSLRRQPVRRIVELGVGDAQRSVRMIEMAGRLVPVGEIQYTGIDPFEDRTAQDGPGVTLKLAHRLLRRTGATVRLVPGDPLDGLARTANALGKIDLLVISARLGPARLAPAWFFVPRLLHQQTLVFRETALAGGRRSAALMPHDEIAALAGAASRRRAA
jgi:hypothetical protein